MSRLAPNLLVLDKGLDLQTAKLVAAEGSVSDTLNYEQVDFQGQKRIDGYTRYDGSPLSAIDDFFLVESATLVDFSPYTLVFNDEKLLGVWLGNVEIDSVAYDAIAVIDYTNLPYGQWGIDSGLTPDEHYDYLLNFNQFLRDKVEELPGPIIGLHWFRDRLYAVVDIDNYTPDDSRIDTIGNASLFESRSVQQVLDEDSGPYDFGWKFVHQGWWVEFENGKVLYGDLTAKNQNRANVGIEGPTSISGTSGSPLILFQKIAITNGNTQVNGWKSSDTPTSYILNPGDVSQLDDDYTYADAYVTWDGETGAVSAPGSNGVGLIEYAASNTINVEV